MWTYWGRILAALVLLKIAGSVMKDAEKLVGTSMGAKPVVEAEVVKETIVPVATTNGAVEMQTDHEVEEELTEDERMQRDLEA